MTHSNDDLGEVNGETVRMVEIENGDVEIVDTRVESGWGNKIEFILACVGYAVGLGNVWRFPYLCQKNGGGAFLIPYFFSLFFLGVPLFYLEMCIGQRLRKGSIGVWNEISPYLGGLGMASCIVSFFVGMYYNMIIAWCLYYLGISFQAEMPYGTCIKGNTTIPDCVKAGSTQYYWYHVTLEATRTILDGGGFNWKTTVALLGAWIIVYVCVIRGVQSMGKAVYFTATFPYLVLIIFFFRGVTLEGCGAGLAHLFTPKFEHLMNAQVWLEAATQIFFSLGLAFGGLIAMSSYNPIHNNARRDALIVAYINSGTSIFASLVVFSILGFRGTQKLKQCNAEFEKLNGTLNATSPCFTLEYYIQEAGQGPGLTFIAFTEAITQLPASPLWSVLFFLMLLTLGLGSMFGTVEGILTALNDLRLIPVRKEFLSALICVVSFLSGLIFCQRSGDYWLQLFDSFSATLPLLVIGFFESVGVCYIYGIKRFQSDIEYMVGVSPGLYWKICWMFICPISLFVIFMASIIQLATSPIGYNSWDAAKGMVQMNTKYPWFGLLVIVFLVMTATMFIPFVAFVRWLGINKYDGPPRSTEDDHIPHGSITPSLSRVPLAPAEIPPSTVPTEDPDDYDGQNSRL